MLYISEISSLEERVGIFIKLGILIVDLDLMECVVSHSSGVYDKSTLSDIDVGIFLVILVILSIVVDDWENWIRVTNDLTWNKFTNFADFKESPVEETAFVELTKVHRDLYSLVILVENV